jgi:protocatechuate 3,4-dioxygenase beta subunit
MLTQNLIRIFVLCTIGISLFSCTPEITLHGDITGVVIDSVTSEPVQGASVELIQSHIVTDSTQTGSDGTYLLKNITPGEYEIQASKYS